MRNMVQIDSSRSGDSYFVSYALPGLNPNQGANIDEPIFIEPTVFAGSVTVPRFGVQLDYQAEYRKRFEVSISGEDVALVTYSIEVHMLPAKSTAQLREAFMQREQALAASLRKATTFRKYLGSLMKETEQTTVLHFPVLAPLVLGRDTAWLSKGPASDTLMFVSYDPVRWSLLF